ncbi:hypothetical protein ARMGADRAFT_1084777 [Armillaria gallica]|uniref:Uncharacterized protein n=1 Tax=Armillaria gallica TaxID=47427 RepID=A0A2H3DB94_ARMGA|nr:hypothetical protein ARMGADRAFT_1084777 [Armillaria gallica]
MLIEWSIDLYTCDPGNCSEVNISFGTNLIAKAARHEDSPYINNWFTDPIVVWNVSSSNLGSDGPTRGGYNPTFRTELIICLVGHNAQRVLEHSYASLVYYPFDRYNSEIFAFAQDASTKESVSLVLNSVTGRILGLKIETDFIARGDTAYWEEEFPAKEVIDMRVTLQRSTLVIAYCLIITFTFCLSTLAQGYCPYGHSRNEIVVVPIGTVFSFTQLRSSMPGAPEGFGFILDFAGLLPCLVLWSISAVTMVGIYLFADTDNSRRKSFAWDELVNALHDYVLSIRNTVNEWAALVGDAAPIGKNRHRNNPAIFGTGTMWLENAWMRWRPKGTLDGLRMVVCDSPALLEVRTPGIPIRTPTPGTRDHQGEIKHNLHGQYANSLHTFRLIFTSKTHPKSSHATQTHPPTLHFRHASPLQVYAHVLD